MTIQELCHLGYTLTTDVPDETYYPSNKKDNNWAIKIRKISNILVITRIKTIVNRCLGEKKCSAALIMWRNVDYHNEQPLFLTGLWKNLTD